MITLAAFYRRKAEAFKRLFARRVGRGLGVGGKRLKRKERPDGRPLGGRSIPSDLRRGRVTASDNGFAIDYGGAKNLGRFNNGTPGGRQEPRPVYGITQDEREEIRAEAREELVRQLNKGVS